MHLAWHRRQQPHAIQIPGCRVVLLGREKLNPVLLLHSGAKGEKQLSLVGQPQPQKVVLPLALDRVAINVVTAHWRRDDNRHAALNPRGDGQHVVAKHQVHRQPAKGCTRQSCKPKGEHAPPVCTQVKLWIHFRLPE